MPTDPHPLPDLIDPALALPAPAGPARPPLWTSLRRGLARRGPRCGAAPRFKSYLKQVDACAACGERYAHIRADDAAPWLTILIVGHVLIPVVLTVETRTAWPDWVAMSVWPAAALALAALVLPRAKALFVSLIWATRSPGSERE